MKKLMIAAVAAASVGAAFAIDCEIPEEHVCVYAYRVKLAGKTVKAKMLIEAAAGCELGGTNCWAKQASLRIAGYLFDDGKVATGDPEADCECGCILADGTDFSGKQIWWDENKAEVGIAVSTFAWEVLRNSGAKDKAQIFMQMAPLNINLAGFGVYNPKTARLKRAHGFFAGVLAPAECPTCDDPIASLVFDPCNPSADAKASEFAVAYGRWNMAWKHEKVEALIKGAYSEVETTFFDKVPSVLVPAAFKKYATGE